MNLQELEQKSRIIAKTIVKNYFRNDYNEPFELTDKQADIFNCILHRKHSRNQIIASTQYGKSDTVAMALIIRSQSFSENWAIISGQKDKAQIIMGKVLQHIFDNEFFYSKLELDANIPLDRLRRERSKDNITWLTGGGIKTFTANSGNKNRVTESLTGFGAQNIVEDEASLVPNDVQAMILRMLGGHQDNFLLKIGNPFYRNHFFKTWNSSKYNKIFIDYKTGLEEGRYSQDFINEMKEEAFFSVLYECKFPEQSSITPEGYQKLISDELLNKSFITKQEAEKEGMFEGEIKLGADFAGAGNDRSAYVLKYPKLLVIKEVNQIKDTMQQVNILERIKNELRIDDCNISIDYGGLGQGIGDRLHEMDIYTNNVMFGESAPNDERTKYKNMRAYMYYQLFLFLSNGGRILIDDRFQELTLVNFKIDTEKRLQLQSKEDLKKLAKQIGLNIGSPDIADACALCFADNSDIVSVDDFDIL